MVPQLEKEANTDAKTSLWNTRHFNQLFAAELERAKRFGRPLSVIMADLDLLRNINNTYGHLAGDTVLTGIGQLIRQTVREYDIPSRFGGEEFCIVLLEAGQAEALAFAERLRHAVEAAAFGVPTSSAPIHVTMSLGIASFPQDGATPTDLTHEADVAVYQAKLRGRNRVVCAADVPHSAKLENAPAEDTHATTYAAAFASKAEAMGTSASPTVDTSAPPKENKKDSPAIPEKNSKMLLPWFVGGVIAAGVALTILGIFYGAPSNLVIIAMLTALAALAELFQVSIYGDNTVSVSVAMSFAAALIAGLPGVAAVSAGIVLTHYLQKRPPLYKTAFNWSTHVLAGSAPALIIHVWLVPLQMSNVLVLGVLTVVTGLIYYSVDTGLIAIAISLSQGVSLKTTWREQFRWLIFHYLVLCVMGLVLAIAYWMIGLSGVIVFSLPVFMMRYTQKQYIERTEESMRELQRMNRELARANRAITDANQAIRQLNDELFLILAKVIDARDPYVANHASKAADYAAAIAVELGLKVERVEHVRQAALLHDIGKLGIPEQILHKQSRLSDEEYAIVKTHAALGAELLGTCQSLRHLAPFVRHHHEWWDGRGYPDGLQGELIPLEARVLAVCDAVEAMASDRSYQRAASLSEIMAELQSCAGTQFDPVIVHAFINIAEREGERLVTNSAQEVARYQAAQQDGRSYSGEWFVPQPASKSAYSTA
jgi:diguanylate cyclase (GGDEF)-like protein/putative nucleotidyltransferase with HDIG domain